MRVRLLKPGDGSGGSSPGGLHDKRGVPAVKDRAPEGASRVSSTLSKPFFAWGPTPAQACSGLQLMVENPLPTGACSPHLQDRIGDTQDLVNIELDSRYNELEAVNVYLNIYSVAWSFAALVVAVWGVNVCQTCPWHSESGPDSNPWLFWVTVGYIFAIQALIVVIFFTYIQVG